MPAFSRILSGCVFLATLTPLYAQSSAVTSREEELLERIRRLEERLAAIENREPPGSSPVPPASVTPSGANTMPEPSPLLGGTTINLSFDGYYGYNFNKPVGRVNLLRAYDVTSNNLSINQAGLIIERTPDADAGRRFGLRLDLMYGQATETLQGGAQNEPRPQVYRPVFQAYGTYLFPVGKGLSVDFGKFASALGYEGNYSKDQINYSRAYWFNFLPFYHMGFRTTYAINDRVGITNWLVNGANQTEDFNGFKSTAFLINIRPTSKISWNVNYYFGQEHRDLPPDLPVPNGRLQVFDTYAAWSATKKLLLVGEFDTVISRRFENDPPTRATGGAAYLRYQLTPKFSLGTRFEVLKDRGGIYSGASQTLKETTLTATYQIAGGFQTRWEYRRDFSNSPFFLTNTPGQLKKEQNTATLGLIWWFGGKEGSW